jgi:O-methyltransferase
VFRRRETEQASAATTSASSPPARGPLLPYYPPKDYLGQLEPSHQQALAKRRADADLSDFTWYHATELPDGRVLPGVWDLRGHESEYLGGVDVRAKRVFELGPATGYLTFWMERQGAEVVSFEAGFDVPVDTLPVKGEDNPDERLRVMQETIDRNHDGWWHLHHEFGSSAKFVQGNIYDMPADLGTFDVTLVGAILLHLREPWGALSQAARRTTEVMIVTEPLQDDVAAAPPSLARHGERRHRPTHVHGGGAPPARLAAPAQNNPGVPRPRSTTESRKAS